MNQSSFKNLSIRENTNPLYAFVIWFLSKINNVKGVNAVEIWQKNVISLLSTCNYGKTRPNFENLWTPSCSPHHFRLRFVNEWKGEWFFSVGQCYRLPNLLEGFQSASYLFWTSLSLLATTSKFEVESLFLLKFEFFSQKSFTSRLFKIVACTEKKLVHFIIVNQHL